MADRASLHSLMAEGPAGQRRRPQWGWRLAKALYRRSIRWRSYAPLLHHLFTEKEQALNLAMQYAAFNRLQGDYLEFGTYEGNSFIAAYHLARAQGLEAMRFWAFDSFRGLPSATGIDADPAAAAQYFEGDFACDGAAFRRNLRASGVALDRVRIVEGFYDESLGEELRAELAGRRAAVVLVDCDFYESTRLVLDFLTPCLADGAVLLLDDWFNFKGDPRRGEQRAWNEWLATHPQLSASRYSAYSWHGVSFLLHRLDVADPPSDASA